MTELAAQIEKETGRSVDPLTLAAWLKEHKDDGLAFTTAGLMPLLIQLVGRPVVPPPVAQAADAGSGTDPSTLLDLLSATFGNQTLAGGASGTSEPAAGSLLKALHAGKQGAQPLLETEAGDSKGQAAFLHLLQNAAAAVQGGIGLPGNESHVAIPTMQINHPVTQAGFGQTIGNHLVWMAQQGVHHARLQLNPPELGPLHITLSLHDDKIRVALHADHAQTREVLAADAPRLRSLLTGAGFSAVDVNVSQDQGQSGQHPAGGVPEVFVPTGAGAAVEPVELGQGDGSRHHGHSLVDHYA